MIIKQKQLVGVKTDDGINLDLVIPETTLHWIIAGEQVVMEVNGVITYRITFPITAFTEDFLKEISLTI